MLYPLSYWGIPSFYSIMSCIWIGTSHRLGGGCSILLSYMGLYLAIVMENQVSVKEKPRRVCARRRKEDRSSVILPQTVLAAAFGTFAVSRKRDFLSVNVKRRLPPFVPATVSASHGEDYSPRLNGAVPVPETSVHLL